MDTKALRQKILDLAIRGKLVPQDPNDEPASFLLERIRAEKERLIAEGKIKRPKKAKSSSSESHYQKFDIPESWEWTTLGEIFSLQAGKNIQASKLKEYSDESPYPCYGGNGIRGYLPKYSHEGLYPIVGRQGALCGNINMASGKFYATEHAVVVDYFANTEPLLWRYFLEFLNLNQYATATAQPGLSVAKIEKLPIPLPPIQEQIRIVKAVESWFGRITLLEKDTISLNECIATIKSKILELAMQGKLVPQDPADEPAADMLRRINPKARIITDNPHYPKWLCSYLGDICGFERGITFPSDTKRFDKIPGYIACLRTANVHDEVDLSSLWYISEEYLKGNDAKKLKAGDILMSTANSKELVGRSVIIRNLSEPATFGGFVTVLRTQILLPEFFKLFLKYKTLKGDFSKIATQTTNIANLNTKILSTVITPIPPRVEQSRIIQRVNQLFSILEEIEASLQSTL